MLRDRYRQLLSAYVDGELSSRQRRNIVRLLYRSAEARQLLQQLKADACILRQLPRPPLPADLTDHVLHLIAERQLKPSQHRIAVVKAASATAWMGPIASWAVAAAVLLVLGVASYFYFAASLGQPTITEIAQNQPELSAPITQPEEPGPPIAKDDGDQERASEPTLPKADRPPIVKPPKVVQQRGDRPKPNVPDKPPLLPKEQAAPLTERLEMFQFERVPDLLPVIIKISDLDRPPARKKLIAELQNDSAFRLELPCPNGTKAFDRVQKAARKLRIGLIIDKPAQERIKLKWRVSYALYIENVTPEQLTQFVRQIKLEDRKRAAGKAAEAQIDRLVLMRMSASHHKELTTLLGVDPTITVPNATGPLGADPRNSLTDVTARQVGQALAGQGGVPRPGPGKSISQPPENIALVLAYNPVHPSPGSDEIKQFLESRKPARPGTVCVVLVLRSGS